MLQPFILRPPLIIRGLDLVPNCHSVLNDLYFMATFNIRPHVHGPIGGLEIEGPLYTIIEHCLDRLSLSQEIGPLQTGGLASQ